MVKNRHGNQQNYVIQVIFLGFLHYFACFSLSIMSSTPPNVPFSGKTIKDKKKFCSKNIRPFIVDAWVDLVGQSSPIFSNSPRRVTPVPFGGEQVQ